MDMPASWSRKQKIGWVGVWGGRAPGTDATDPAEPRDLLRLNLLPAALG